MYRNNKILKNIVLFIFFLFISKTSFSQFAPPVGQSGCTAIYKDSSVFVSWATGCKIIRGLQNIADSSLGYANTGDSLSAIGSAGESGVVSLGDGGCAIMTFSVPVKNGQGYDFAVFENSFNDTFLELAFVEVSSDGEHFYRFHSSSFTQDTMQVDSYGSIDATKINNLAGKYRALYGTPFDLEELKNDAGLDVNNIKYVKIIDVIGCIQNAYCTYDYYGNKINDPWSTPFPGSGFDLDAIGVINQNSNEVSQFFNNENQINIYPNPITNNTLSVDIHGNIIDSVCVEIYDITGNVKLKINTSENHLIINTQNLLLGIYFIHFNFKNFNITKKVIILN